jgi:NhaP-type Na+/H+ or K+/H+ antiporter
VPNRMAAVCALTVFAFCLIVGMRAQNTFSTTVTRALVAMAGTFAVGLALGWVAQRMLDENVKAEERRLKDPSEKGS